MPTVNAKSRGYQKISAAATALGIDFRGKLVLDIGSSTGGFTEYALARGATKVIAVEKGTRQMAAPLRLDPRIELHEKTDIFGVKIGKLDMAQSHGSETGLLPDFPDIILADVSFLSLTKILKYASIYLTGSNTQFLVMLKPQFEAQPHQLTKGIVKNEAIRRQIIKNFESWLRTNHFVTLGKRDNHLSGRHGNTERFYHLSITKHGTISS